MCSATSSPSCLFLPTNTPLIQRSKFSIFNSPSPRFLCCLRPTIPRPHLSASLAERDPERSWFSTNQNPSDDYGGWAIFEYPVQQKRRKAFHSYVIVGIGTSLALLVAVLASFSILRKGFKIQFGGPLQVLHGLLSPFKSEGDHKKGAESDTSNGSNLKPKEATPVNFVPTVASEAINKPERVVIPVAVDSTQEEALSVLKKLKIIEDNVEANELCTRREYARWIVKLNSFLERSPKYRITPMVSISGSVVNAFDDINSEDQDFRSIQALAEAGVLPSKLSWKNCSNSHEGQENTQFFPDRFIARQDLIDWRAQFEYEIFPGVINQVSSNKVSCYMDVKEISPYVSPLLYVDMLAGNRSIVRKVFGQSKRFQPKKPSTKAQAAVALISGRMTEAISAELSRIDAENSARQAEAEEIRSELLSRGDIQGFWAGRLNEENIRGAEVESLYHEALDKLQKEKVYQDKIYAEYLKEKTAVDCQRQLLLNLKKDVDELSKKLVSEKVTYLDEKHVVQKSLRDLEAKHEQMLDRKSTMEAEKEALQILRSWVEDEARKSQARAAVLEEVGRRWRWENQG